MFKIFTKILFSYCFFLNSFIYDNNNNTNMFYILLELNYNFSLFY